MARRRLPEKLYRIGEVMEHSGLSRQTLHNWCQLGLICEAEQTESGHRLYDGSVFARLERIQRPNFRTQISAFASERASAGT